MTVIGDQNTPVDAPPGAVLDDAASERIYLNFIGDEGEERVRTAFDPETYQRLVALKDKYDPSNVLCLNQNIKPSHKQPQPVS